MRPDSASAPAPDATLVAEYVLQNMPDVERRAFEARLVQEPELRRKVDEYRTDLERRKKALPAATASDSAWAAVDAELKRHNALDGIDSENASDQPSAPAGCTESKA